MARYSSAYSNLTKRLKEVESLIRMAQKTVTVSPRPDDFKRANALCRSGIILLCNHLEGYVETLGIIGIQRIGVKRIPKSNVSVAFKYHLSRDLIKEIKESTDPSVIASKIDGFISRDIDIWDDTPTYSSPLPFESFVGDFATPKHNNIERFFRRFGYCTFLNDLQSLLRGECSVCLNMIDNIVDQRNKIAHGDYSIAGSPTDLKEMHRLLKLYCTSTDQVVGNWFKMLGCPIR